MQTRDITGLNIYTNIFEFPPPLNASKISDIQLMKQ